MEAEVFTCRNSSFSQMGELYNLTHRSKHALIKQGVDLGPVFYALQECRFSSLLFKFFSSDLLIFLIFFDRFM